jgi:hypothetical protein
VLNNFDDKMNGRDPQLDKAIEVILGRWKEIKDRFICFFNSLNIPAY